MPKIREVYAFIDALAPFNTAEGWDNCGVLVNAGESADNILLSLDITSDTVSEAAALGCKLILSHHPVIFTALKSVDNSGVVYKLIENGISAICAHTNLDKASNNVSMALAQQLCLKNIRRLEPFGALGELEHSASPKELAGHCALRLGATVQLSSAGKAIKTIAAFGGSGADYILQAKEAGADCLITGEAGHHDAILAQEQGITLIAAGHFETENAIIIQLAKLLQANFPAAIINISQQKSPFVAVAGL